MSFFEDASLVYIPSAVKSGKTYSVKPTDGTGDLTFTRASNATRVASNGLIEKVRTNELTYSNDFSNAAWTNTDSAEASGQSDPDGGTTAWKITETTTATGATSRLAQSITTSAGTLSFYAKAGEITQMLVFFSGAIDGVYFNLSTGAFISYYNTGSVFSSVNAVSVGGGWYRYSITLNTNITSVDFYSAALNNFIHNTVSGNGYFLWRTQYETSDIATDYIATTTAAVSVGPVSGLPRLDYLNSSCPRLILEPQRTNVALQSESVTTSVTNVGYTATSNATTSPDGYANADLLLEDTSTLHLLQKEFSVASTTDSYAVSFFVKANGRTSGRILYGLNGAPFSSVGATFNLTAGTITAASGDAPAVAGTSKIENYGNGWYRVSVNGVMGTAGTHYVRIQDANGGAAGDPTKGFYVYGFQAELGAYATSYIPTLGTSVTRVADAASKTGISSLIGQTEGAFMIDVNLDARASFTYFALAPNLALADNYLGIGINAGSIVFESVASASLQAAITLTNSATGRFKIAVAYKANDFVMYVNGTQVGTATSGSVPTCSQIGLYNYNQTPSVKYNQALLFKTRLTNAQLAELTA